MRYQHYAKSLCRLPFKTLATPKIMSLALFYKWEKSRGWITYTRLGSSRVQFSVWFGSDPEACVLKTMQYCKVQRLSWGMKSSLRFKCGSGEHIWKQGPSEQTNTHPSLRFQLGREKQAWTRVWTRSQDLTQHREPGKALQRGQWSWKGSYICNTPTTTKALKIHMQTFGIWLLGLCTGTEPVPARVIKHPPL